MARSPVQKKLSVVTPVASVFHPSVILSLLGQIVLHLYCLFQGWTAAIEFRSIDYKRDLEGDFEPNLTNTVIFILCSTMHVSSFVGNYEGRPFLCPLHENKTLSYAIGGFFAFLLLCVSEIFPPINYLVSLQELPSEELRWFLVRLMFLDLCGTSAISYGLSYLRISWVEKEREGQVPQWKKYRPR